MSSQPILAYKIINLCASIPKSILRQLEDHRFALCQLKSLLPDSLRESLIDCVIKDDTLLIYTGSSVWASQLRFYSPALLQAMNKQTMPSIRRVQIKVLPPVMPQPKMQFTHRIPSKATVKHLANNGGSLADSELKRSLLRLARSLEKRLL